MHRMQRERRSERAMQLVSVKLKHFFFEKKYQNETYQHHETGDGDVVALAQLNAPIRHGLEGT